MCRSAPAKDAVTQERRARGEEACWQDEHGYLREGVEHEEWRCHEELEEEEPHSAKTLVSASRMAAIAEGASNSAFPKASSMLSAGFLLQAAADCFTERDVAALAASCSRARVDLQSADGQWLLAHPASLRSVSQCHLPSIATLDATDVLFASAEARSVQPRKRLQTKFDIELEYAMLHRSRARQCYLLRGGEDMSHVIAQTINGPNSLRKLTLGWPSIDYSDLIPNLPTQLTSLTLHFLRQRDLALLTEKLRDMSSLAHVKLGFCEDPEGDPGYICTDKGDALMASVVRALPTSLRSLDLSSAYYARPAGAKTCAALVQFLPHLDRLSELHLQFDELRLPYVNQLVSEWSSSGRNAPQVREVSAWHGVRYLFYCMPH
mmetsp:Transcript_160197/g.283765  ORF Transcript_160197/g.283765 Transcript_160197/m.283765 type:complete len:378 (-) Transcript_160197:52-1185(-)